MGDKINKHYQIAIDGPVGVGSSTTAKLVAEKLEFLFVDTGAMYRAVTLLSLEAGVSLEDEGRVLDLVKKSTIELNKPGSAEKDGRLITVVLNGEDVSWKIRTSEVSRSVSVVASMPKVREVLVGIQQKIASVQDVVMEGRDITYKVLPDADLKIYLSASEEERAARRHNQLQTKGEIVSIAQVLENLKKRDDMDMNRGTDPLKIVDDAWVLDTSNLNIDQVVDKIIEKFISIRDKHD